MASSPKLPATFTPPARLLLARVRPRPRAQHCQLWQLPAGAARLPKVTPIAALREAATRRAHPFGHELCELPSRPPEQKGRIAEQS
jgi:hypothetical protein